MAESAQTETRKLAAIMFTDIEKSLKIVGFR